MDSMRKYTSDPCILKIIESFFDDESDDEGMNRGTRDDINFDGIFRRIVYECVAQDKLYFLSFWISILKVNCTIVEMIEGHLAFATVLSRSYAVLFYPSVIRFYARFASFPTAIIRGKLNYSARRFCTRI